MERIVEYITIGEIQKYKEQWHAKHNSGIGFKATLQALTNAGKVHTGVPEMPDFLQWNLESMSQFRRLTDQVPVYLKEELYVETPVCDDMISLRLTKDVSIGFETFYTSRELLIVDYFTIIYVLSGQGSLHTKSRSVIMEKGELCILPPSIPYYVYTTSNDIVIYICSSKDHFEKEFQTLLFHNNPVSCFFRDCLFHNNSDPLFFMVPITKDIKSIIQHLFMEHLQTKLYSQASFYSYLKIFYINIIRSSQNTHDYYVEKKQESKSVMACSLVPAILEYLEENYDTASLNQVSQMFNYEPTYFCRFIKKYTGRNFIDIITDIKMQKAKQFLAQTDYNIETISGMCGYRSADHFTSTFKKVNLCTPREYRNRIKSEQRESGTSPGIRQDLTGQYPSLFVN